MLQYLCIQFCQIHFVGQGFSYLPFNVKSAQVKTFSKRKWEKEDRRYQKEIGNELSLSIFSYLPAIP